MADKIQVAVRVRPVLFQKKDVEVHWGCEKGMIYQIDPATKKRLGNPYLFDQVFEPQTQNHQIFMSLVQPLIDSAMDGFNVTVLAYGQTASGKTYTMMGSQKECGIVQLAVDRIFTTIEQNPERAFLLRCSYIEIYNETISDLLSTTHQKLKLQELAEGNVIVHNLIETNVNSPDAVIKLMHQGNKHRKVGGTSMNERSSRSHTIFRIIVESCPRAEADRTDAAVMVSHINLVDLAGSEKASQTHATGDRFREGCAINTSLSALSLVIKQLSEGEGFVNFRDSKLTHILRASLGGNARTAIICSVTPTVLDETSSTLKFACSAKTVQNQPHVNEVLSDQALLRKYNNYIKDLEKKLKEKEQEQRPEALEEMERLLQEKEMKIHELKEKLVTSSVNTGGDNQISSSQRSLRRMTWGGNRLKQMLNFPPVPVFENAPVFASVGINRMRRTSFKSRKSDPSSFDESGESDCMDSETFVPAEAVFAKPGEPVAKVDASTMTELPQESPFRCLRPIESPFRRPQTPGTPVPVLRERMMQLRKSLEEREQENNDLREELEDLSNFTRLEQQIGVHAQATAKSCANQETAEQLHKALQTANDMEVLYLDTQRKLSELQTQYKEKEVAYENEMQSLKADYQQRLDEETSERKRLAKELSVLKEKHERLERDQAEADTHLQVVVERHTKREADLRQSLQEAWAQLESTGQNPAAYKEGLAAKEQVVKLGKEIEEMQSKYEEAQAQISALSEELKCAKESANESALAASEQVENMAKEIESMQSKYEEAQAQILALSEELKCANETSNANASTAMEQLNKMTKETEEMQCKYEEAQTQILALNEELRCANETSTANASTALEQLDKMAKEIEDMLSKYEEAQAQIITLSEELKCAKEISAESSLDIEQASKMRKEIEETQSKYEEAQAQILALSEELKCAKETANESVLAASEQVGDMAKEMESMQSRFEEAQSQILALGEELKCANETSNSNASTAMEQLNKMTKEIEDMQSKYEEAQAQIIMLSEELKCAKESSNESSLAIEQAGKMGKEIEEMQSKYEEAQAQILALSEELECAKESSNENSFAAIEQAGKMSKQIEEMQSKYDEAQAQIAALSEELKHAKETAASITFASPKQDQLDSSLGGVCLADELRDVFMEHDSSFARSSVRPRKRPSSILSVALARMEQSTCVIEGEQDVQPVKKTRFSVASVQTDEVDSEVKEIREYLVELQAVLVRYEEDYELLTREKEAISNQLMATQKEASSLREALCLTRTTRRSSAREDASPNKIDAFPEEFEASCIMEEQSPSNVEMEVTGDEIPPPVESGIPGETGNIGQELLAEELEELNQLKRHNDQEREKLEELVERLTCQLEELEQKIEEKDQQLNDARDAAYQTSIQQKEAVEAERLKSQREVFSLEEQLNELRAQLASTSNELDRVQHELFDSSTKTSELLLGKQNLELHIQSLEAKLRELEEEVRSARAEAGETCDSVQLSKLESELEEARKRVEELQFTNDILQADLTSAEVRSGELEAQLEAKNEAVRKAENARETLDEVRQQLTVKTEQICELKTKLEEADIQIADLCSQKEEVRAELIEAKQRIQSLEEDVESERDALLATQRAAKETSNAMEAKLAELETEKEKLNQLLNGAIEEVEKLRQSVETASSELQAAKAEIVTLQETNRVNSVPRENLTALEQEWKDAVLKISELESLLEMEKSKFNDASQKMKASKSEIEQLECHLKKYSAEIESLQRNVHDLSNRNVNQNEEIEQLQSALRAVEDELLNLRASSGKISTLEGQLDALNRELVHLSRVVEEKNAKISSLEEELSYVSQGEQSRLEQIQHMEKKLKERQTELEDTLSLLVAMQTENEKISYDLSEKENQNVELRNILENGKQRFEVLQAKLEAVQTEKSRLVQQMQRLEAEVDCREQELQGLRGGMESLHHEREMCQQLKQRLSSLQTEKEAAVQHCEKLREARDELLCHQEQLKQNLQELEARFQASEWAKKSIEQTLAHYSSEKEDLLKNHQRLKEELLQADKSFKEEIRRLVSELQAANASKETLERTIAQYEAQKEMFLQEYHRLKEALASTEERLGREVRELSDRLQASNADKTALEQSMAQFETCKETVHQLKRSLTETEEQLNVVQAQRDEYLSQLKSLSDQMSDARAKITAFESAPKYQTQRQLEDKIDALKRELFEMRSNSEVVRLNFQTEDEQKKKKIDRLEKELESLKQQYVKCKEQLRLSRYRENEEGTVSLPKMRSSGSTMCTYVQTDPIADKGFGFRWQADQYSADNERLRKKCSELGERMEYYREKLVKYRNLHYQATGQDPNQRPASGGANPIHHLERRSSTSSNLKEQVADNPKVESEKGVGRRTLTPTLSSGTQTDQRVVEPAIQTRAPAGHLPVRSSQSAGAKKLSKEQMENMNNCNPS